MNDWPWPVVLALALPPAIGHLAHFVLLINVVSGLGYSETAMDRVRLFLFAALWVSSAAAPLDASPAPLLDLALATFWICHTLCDLRPHRRAPRIAVPGIAPTAARHHRHIPNHRPGARKG